MTRERKKKVTKSFLTVLLGLLVSIVSSRVATSDPDLDLAVRTAIETTASVIIEVVSSQDNDTIKTNTVLFPAENEAIKTN